MNLDTLKTRIAHLDEPIPRTTVHLCYPCQQALRRVEPTVRAEFAGKTILEEALAGVTRCIHCRWAEYLQGN